MNKIQAIRCLGIVLLAGAACREGRAASIIIVNSGAASDAHSYYNSYDTTVGYNTNNQGGGVTTNSGTALGLFANTLGGSIIDPNAVAGREGHASSTVSANLATGEIKIYEDTGSCYATGIPACGGSVNAAGTLNDALTFHNTTGAAVTVGLTYRATLDATIQAVPLSNGTFIYSTLEGSTGFSMLGVRISYDFANCGVLDCGFLDGSRSGGWDTLSMSQSGTFGEAFSATVSLAPGDTLTPIFENFNPVCLGGAQCDGTHTAAIVLNLPTGVTFTSESGIFLTQQGDVAAAPEPGTWILMGIGVLALVGKKTRFRASL